MRKLYRLLLGLLILEAVLQIGAYIPFLFREVPIGLRRYTIAREHWFTSRPDRVWWNKESYVLEKHTAYHPFFGFFTRDIATDHITVDTFGIRRTVGNPTSGKELRQVYLFGGSTMMGYYAGDDETIASFVAQDLNRDHPRVIVTNFGQSAFVNSQELLELVLEFKKGSRPDMVIFYDGCNELSLASGEEGKSIFYERELQNQVNHFISSPVEAENNTIFSKSFLLDLLDHIQIVRLIRNIFQTSRNNTAEDTASRIDRLVRTIKQNASVVDSLAASYRFSYALVWQPMSFTKPLTTEEKKTFVVSPDVYESMKDIYLTATKELTALNNPHFYDLTQEFSRWSSRSIFIDSCHITPEGNRMIAQRISDIIRQAFGWQN